MYSVVAEYSVPQIQVHYIKFIVWFKYILFTSLGLLVLSIAERDIFKLLIFIVDLTILVVVSIFALCILRPCY